MGIFDFLKGVGLGPKLNPGQEAQEIKDEINRQIPGQIDGLNVSYAEDHTVKLFGAAQTQAAREKAVLIAGNHDGVTRVDDQLTISATTMAQQVAAAQAAAPAEFYTIQKGDSLSKIAGAKYGDVHAWKELYEANKEVIGDNPDKIFPGQQIRIPAR
ncbi:MAG: LysM peptidoglycan-binding domain-containing protein [Rhodothermales bacterium]|nr:LysM peptidoglycan-binding domain-containing protein [Rhodothermales bacterium]